MTAACESSVSESAKQALFLPYQRRWCEDAARIKIMEKSRQVGITWATAGWVTLEAANGAYDVWYMSYTEDASKEFIRDCAMWASAFNLGAKELGQVIIYEKDDGDPKGVKALQILFPSGKRITAIVSSPRVLRGKRGLLIIDEAAFHDDLPGVLKASKALMMWGGKIMMISTHNGVDSHFNKEIEKVRAGEYSKVRANGEVVTNYSLHRVTLDDAVRDGLYRRVCVKARQEWSAEGEREYVEDLRLDSGDDAAEELDCIPAKGGASFFPRNLVESRMHSAPVLTMFVDDDFKMLSAEEREAHVQTWLDSEVAELLAKLPESQTHYVGYDFGRASDLSCMCPLTLEKNLTRRAPFMIELGNVPHEQQKQVAFYVLDRLPRLACARFDAGGNGSYLAEVCAQRYGDIVEEVHITEGWHREEWAPLKAAFESATISLPRNEAVRNDFAMVKRVNGIPKLPSATTLKAAETGIGKSLKRHGDAAVAAALAYNGSRRGEAELARWDALTSL